MFRALFSSPNTSVAVEEKLVTLQVGKRVFTDVDSSLRRELWLSVLQRSRAASRAAASYPSLLSSATATEDDEGDEGDGVERGERAGTVPRDVVDSIWRDVGRTFPGVRGFEPQDPSFSDSCSTPRSSRFRRRRTSNLNAAVPGARARALARVLTAYSAFDPEIGYCQGMNFLAGLLLIYLDAGRGGGDGDGGDGDADDGDDAAERAAFGLLTHLLMTKNLRALYLDGMEALTARLSHLHDLLPPRTRELLDERLGVPVTLFAAPWFMTLFASDFPVSVSARLVDAMLTTPPAVDRPLLRLALACVRACERKLLSAKDAEAAVAVLRKDLPSKRVSKLHDLVSSAFEREWSEDELRVLSSEGSGRVTREEVAAEAEGKRERPPPSSRSSSPPPRTATEEKEAVPAQSPQQPRKLKWEAALRARRSVSVSKEGEGGGGGGTSSDDDDDNLLHLPLPPPSPSRLSKGKATEPADAASSTAEAALAELLSCKLEVGNGPSSSASPFATAATASTTERAPSLSSLGGVDGDEEDGSLWTSFRRAPSMLPSSAAAKAKAETAEEARRRAAAELEEWTSFKQSDSF